MDPRLVASSSPFLQEQHDFQPSSSTSAAFDLSHPETSPYLVDSFAFDQDYAPDGGPFPHTPSYQGSYQNSPYSVLSDLPTFGNEEGPDSLSLFDDNPTGISITEEYDPSEYDPPNSTGLISFDEGFMSAMDGHVSVSITPPAHDEGSPSPYDHASPASSVGAEDDRRSHGSNASPYMHPNSPPLGDFTQNFESMHFESPSWSTSRLPDRRSPPAPQKAPSPPQLVIPDMASPSNSVHDAPPTINAPEGDGLGNGPQLHIVPATPISGGGGVGQNVQYLQRGSSREANWDQQTHLPPQTGNQSLASANQYTDQSQPYYPGSNHTSPGMSYAAIPPDTSSPPARTRQHQNFLVPQIPLARSRSMSDTSLRPPTWDTAPMPNSTVNMNDVLPAPGSASPSPSPIPSQRLSTSAGPHQTTFGQNFAPPPRMPQHNSFCPPTNNLTPYTMANDFLSADIGAANLRRAKSDGMRSGFGHRQVRSEDLRYSPSLSAATGSAMFPPPGPSQREFLNQQFLHPTATIPTIAGRGLGHRRSSSGSRERPVGWNNGVGSARASPYPSPNASPRPGYHTLPGGPELGMGIPSQRRMGVDMGMSMGGMMDASLSMQVGPAGESMTVTKVNVTTPSTADASQKRRKQPANFACPVPGCGSTFTRHFNLKGHLRSHAEEKPYQCKWPGCGKGFARQHDCKRHEQLHLNIRPYPCEGCKKNFARMDALNRHLRSEGGAECRKIQKEMRPNGDEADGSDSSAAASMMKPDPDGNWTPNGILV